LLTPSQTKLTGIYVAKELKRGENSSGGQGQSTPLAITPSGAHRPACSASLMLLLPSLLPLPLLLLLPLCQSLHT